MKLVEIKDVRIGQVYKTLNGFVVVNKNFLYEHFDDNGNLVKSNIAIKYNPGNLIGKLGITHRIEGNKLVEIPPVFKNQKINTDDIVKILKDGSGPWVVDTTYNARKYTHYISLLSYHDCDFSEDEVEKIGILGVTHEFVNDREA